jgi:hypothetical protein
MVKKFGLAVALLVVMLVLISPPRAEAAVRFGISVGPVYSYPAYPYVVSPYPYAYSYPYAYQYSPYAYPYGYPAPVYVYPNRGYRHYRDRHYRAYRGRDHDRSRHGNSFRGHDRHDRRR